MGENVVLLRNSERSTYRRCRLKWHWSYNLRLSPEHEKGALTFGTLVHKALEEYYIPGRKRGKKPHLTFEKLYAAKDSQDFSQWDEEGNSVPALDLGMEMLKGYVETYGKEDHLEVIHPEMAMEVDVFDTKGNYVCTWVGQGDALVRDHSMRRPTLRFLEHKTAKTIEEELRVNSGYGEQGLSYFWAASTFLRHHGLLAEGEQLDGVVFNWLRKALPDPRQKNAQGHALNKDGSISKRQPRPLFHRYPLQFGEDELNSINRRIRAEAQEIAMVRRKKLPMLKNPTKDCAWDCPFKEPCELHEMGGDFESVLQLEFSQWDPYSNHELGEEKS